MSGLQILSAVGNEHDDVPNRQDGSRSSCMEELTLVQTEDEERKKIVHKKAVPFEMPITLVGPMPRPHGINLDLWTHSRT